MGQKSWGFKINWTLLFLAKSEDGKNMPFGIYKTQDNFSHNYILHNAVQLLFLIYANTLDIMKQIYFCSDNLFLFGLSSTPHPSIHAYMHTHKIYLNHINFNCKTEIHIS